MHSRSGRRRLRGGQVHWGPGLLLRVLWHGMHSRIRHPRRWLLPLPLRGCSAAVTVNEDGCTRLCHTGSCSVREAVRAASA